MSAQLAAQSVADIDKGIVLASAFVEAEPGEVFRMLTTPGEIVAWWGAEDAYRLENWTADLRVGGAWGAKGRQADGAGFSVEGEFLAIERPGRLSHTWKADWDQGPPAIVTYLIEAAEGGSMVTLRHEGPPETADATRSYAAGWKMVLGWLAARLRPSSPEPRYYHFRLNPPRATFPGDMTAPEREAMQAHFGYWAKLSGLGTAVVYGPVDDPGGTWGLAVVRVADADAARALIANDPIIQAGLGFRYDVAPLVQALVAT